MNSCETSFWFWFMKPFAEIMAGLAVLIFVVLCFMASIWINEWASKRKEIKK